MDDFTPSDGIFSLLTINEQRGKPIYLEGKKNRERPHVEVRMGKKVKKKEGKRWKKLVYICNIAAQIELTWRIPGTH